MRLQGVWRRAPGLTATFPSLRLPSGGIARLWRWMRATFARLSVAQKFFTIILVEILSYSGVTLIALSQIHSVGDEVERLARFQIPLLGATEGIRSDLQEGRLSFREMIFVGDRVVYDKAAERSFRASLANYETHRNRISVGIERAEAIIANATADIGPISGLVYDETDGLLTRLEAIRGAAQLHDALVQRIVEHIENGSFLMGLEMFADVETAEARLSGQLDTLVALLDQIKEASQRFASRVERAASLFVLVASALTVVMVVCFFLAIMRNSLTRPLRILTHDMESFSVAEEQSVGPLETELALRKDELGYVGRTFARLKQDLRERNRALADARDEAEKANRAKSYFLAAASHDLRQPLHAMQLYIEALRHRLSDPKALAILTDLDSVAASSGAMLNTLLDISQLEAGMLEPQMSAFDVSEVLQRVVRAHYPAAYSKGIALRLAPCRRMVLSDPMFMERIVSNLVSNAIRYTERGKILVGCRRRGDRIAVEVLDTGLGIAPDSLARIYDDFFQCDNHERDRSKGLGLGLAIVRRLAGTLGHRLETYSTVGHGSRFCVVLERASAQESVATATAGAAVSARTHAGKRVLLVEDDATALHATRQLLDLWGFEVVTASCAEKALALSAQKGFACGVLIADFRLPGDENGIDLAKKLRRRYDKNLPTIIVTGESDRSLISLTKSNDFFLLVKPIRPAKLRAVIESALGGPVSPSGRPATADADRVG